MRWKVSKDYYSARMLYFFLKKETLQKNDHIFKFVILMPRIWCKICRSSNQNIYLDTDNISSKQS